MIQQEKNAKMDTIVAKMLMRKEGIPESIAERAINSKPQDQNAIMAAIVARMANRPEDGATIHQNYVDSLQMEREKRMAEERDEQERARRRRQEEMKDSRTFSFWKFFMKNLYNTNEELEKAVLEQMEKDEDDIPNNPPPGGWLPFK